MPRSFSNWNAHRRPIASCDLDDEQQHLNAQLNPTTGPREMKDSISSAPPTPPAHKSVPEINGCILEDSLSDFVDALAKVVDTTNGAMFDERVMGARIRMDLAGNTVEGICVGYDPQTEMVLIEQQLHFEGKTALRMINTSMATGVAVIEPAPLVSRKKPPLPPLPPPDLQESWRRSSRERAMEAANLINTKVTMRTQHIFDALRKTMPCEWKDTEIIVLDEICISPPYIPKSCSGKGAALKRVKKVLAGVLNKMIEHNPYTQIDESGAAGCGPPRAPARS